MLFNQHFIAALPSSLVMSPWKLMDLQSARERFDKVWKVEIKLHKFDPPVHSRPQVLRLKGIETTTHKMYDWEREMIEWLTANIKKQIFINPMNVVYFEDPKEALMFKLTWGGE